MSDYVSICTEESTWTGALTPSATETATEAGCVDSDPVISTLMAEIRRDVAKIAQSLQETPKPANIPKRPKVPSSFSYPAALPDEYLEYALQENYFRHLWFVYRESANTIVSIMHTNAMIRGYKTAHLTLWDTDADKAVLSISARVGSKYPSERSNIKEAYTALVPQLLRALEKRVQDKLEACSQ